MYTQNTRIAGTGQWPLGTAPVSDSVAAIHQCRPSDRSTWKLVLGLPADPKGRFTYSCKGCSKRMLR